MRYAQESTEGANSFVFSFFTGMHLDWLRINLTGVTSQLHGTDGGRFDAISGRMGGKFEMGPGKHRPWKRFCGLVFAQEATLLGCGSRVPQLTCIWSKWVGEADKNVVTQMTCLCRQV